MSDEEAPTVGYICPLYTEIKAVLASFDRNLPSRTIRGSRYFYGMIRDRKVVAVQFSYKQTGPITAANCAHKLIQAHPSLETEGSYCLLVGFAGGIWTPETDVRLGDVVIGTRTWDWRTGKTTSRGFVSTEDPKRAPTYLLDGLGEFLYRRNRLGPMIEDQIVQMQTRSSTKDDGWDFPGQEEDILYKVDYKRPVAPTCEDCDRRQVRKRRSRPDALPRVHDGLVASGNTVLKDAINRETLELRGALAVEMEACGVLELFVCVRGISDYADSHKNDIWQPYAAARAAACARLLIDSLDGHIQPPSCSEINLPLRPSPLNDETQAKPFVHVTTPRVPEAPRLNPPIFPPRLEYTDTEHQIQPLGIGRSVVITSKQGSDGANPDIAKRTQRLIPLVGIAYEPLLQYIEMLDAKATVVHKALEAFEVKAFLITSNVDFTQADVDGIIEDTSLWLGEANRRGTLLPYHHSQTASRRRTLGRNTMLYAEKCFKLSKARFFKTSLLPQTQEDLAPYRPQQDLHVPNITPRSYGVTIPVRINIRADQHTTGQSVTQKIKDEIKVLRSITMRMPRERWDEMVRCQQFTSWAMNTMTEDAIEALRNTG